MVTHGTFYDKLNGRDATKHPMTVMQMRLTLILATVVIGLATVGCRQEPHAPVSNGKGPTDKLTPMEGKTQNGPNKGPASPSSQ